jgi:hypothetical protein
MELIGKVAYLQVKLYGIAYFKFRTKFSWKGSLYNFYRVPRKKSQLQFKRLQI